MSGTIASLIIFGAGILLGCLGWFFTTIVQLKEAVAILLLQVNGGPKEKSLRELLHEVQIQLGARHPGNPRRN